MALWNYGSSVPYSTATLSDIGQFDSKLNQVAERFFSSGTWRSMWRKINLAVYGGVVTLPRGVDTCRQISSCCGPSPIYSQFHRFAAFGVCCDSFTRADGVNVFSGGSGLQLIDENAQTFRIPTGTFTLRAVATGAANPGLSLIGGFDQEGKELFGSINLPLINGASDGTQQYAGLPYIKKVVTNNAVSLYSVDSTTLEATLVASYAPGETIPEYRQYAYGGVTDSEDDPPLVNAVCKLGFVPAIAPTDLVIPSHIGALKLGLMSIQFEDKVDPTNAETYMNKAIALLDSELSELESAEMPVFQVSPNFGCGSIPNLI